MSVATDATLAVDPLTTGPTGEGVPTATSPPSCRPPNFLLAASACPLLLPVRSSDCAVRRPCTPAAMLHRISACLWPL